MQCPKCNNVLEDGYGLVRGTWWGFFFVGWSYQHFWFERAGGKRDVVIHSGSQKRAFRCPQCETVVVPGNRLISPLVD